VSFSNVYARVGGFFRRRRKRWLFEEFHNSQTVVDLGGTVESWASGAFSNTTIVNLIPRGRPVPRDFRYVQADACSVPLEAKFDLAFSNSAIEHVGTRERQQEFANEMMRLGRRVYCQTPNRWFPVETHYLALFVHWLPPRWFGHGLHRYFTLQGVGGASEPRGITEDSRSRIDPVVPVSYRARVGLAQVVCCLARRLVSI
jgi:hypothetical protein